MAGKLTTVLAKKEAEAYCSQGLHQEALRLYQNLLSSSPNLADAFKSAIQGQVNAIKTKLDDLAPQEHQMLSAPEIRRIRKGWGANATESDILVCAQAFCQVGHYQDALSEVAKLLQKGGRIENAVGIFAECLVHLRTPEQLIKIIGPMGKKIIDELKTRCRFFLLLTEEMVRRKHLHHALALYTHLQKDPVICQKAPQRLAAISEGIMQLRNKEIQTGRDSKQKGSAAAKEIKALEKKQPSATSDTHKRKLPGWLHWFQKRPSTAKAKE